MDIWINMRSSRNRRRRGIRKKKTSNNRNNKRKTKKGKKSKGDTVEHKMGEHNNQKELSQDQRKMIKEEVADILFDCS